ncbi:uncharacterized protein LOC135203572 [Macrobrachium nipponense]|uniref:uncharacterized protein LOC135203572 n=1 Tax=Macrobrachium nipponense TaxID=159736 RepID=UPI0030C82FF3
MIMNLDNRWISILVIVATALTVNAVPEIPDTCGSPRLTYVTWADLRNYINKYHKMSIPGTFEGPPLPVNRCHNSLTPCDTSRSFCGVYKQKPTNKTLSLTSDEGAYDLIVEYVEDTVCQCMDKVKYGRRTHSIGSVPFVTKAYYAS